MITRETDYAIRALLRLALQADGGAVSTTVLSESMDIPYRFLRKIVIGLTAKGLVESLRGKQGGLILGRRPEDISLLDIISAMNPTAITLNICLSDAKLCHREPECVVHEALGELQTQLYRSLAGVTLAMLAERDRARRHEH